MGRTTARFVYTLALALPLVALTARDSAAQYCAAPTGNEWFDISGLGGNLSLGNDDDIMCGYPPTFTLFGTTYDNIVIGSNGYVFLTNQGFNPGCSLAPPTGGTLPGNVSLPNASVPNAMIAPLWDDLDPASAGGVHSVVHAQSGQPNRLIVQWDNVPHAGGGGTVQFQAQLEDTTNDIIFCYQDADFGNPSFDFGASATVGIEDDTGTQALQYSFNTASLSNNSCIRIHATCPCADGDGDGYGNPASPSCTFPQLDCNDSNAAVNPGATEVLFNGQDDDCNPATPVNPACVSVSGLDGATATRSADASAFACAVVLPIAVSLALRRRRRTT